MPSTNSYALTALALIDTEKDYSFIANLRHRKLSRRVARRRQHIIAAAELQLTASNLEELNGALANSENLHQLRIQYLEFRENYLPLLHYGNHKQQKLAHASLQQFMRAFIVRYEQLLQMPDQQGQSPAKETAKVLGRDLIQIFQEAANNGAADTKKLIQPHLQLLKEYCRSPIQDNLQLLVRPTRRKKRARALYDTINITGHASLVCSLICYIALCSLTITNPLVITAVTVGMIASFFGYSIPRTITLAYRFRLLHQNHPEYKATLHTSRKIQQQLALLKECQDLHNGLTVANHLLDSLAVMKPHRKSAKSKLQNTLEEVQQQLIRLLTANERKPSHFGATESLQITGKLKTIQPKLKALLRQHSLVTNETLKDLLEPYADLLKAGTELGQWLHTTQTNKMVSAAAYQRFLPETLTRPERVALSNSVQVTVATMPLNPTPLKIQLTEQIVAFYNNNCNKQNPRFWGNITIPAEFNASQQHTAAAQTQSPTFDAAFAFSTATEASREPWLTTSLSPIAMPA